MTTTKVVEVQNTKVVENVPEEKVVEKLSDSNCEYTEELSKNKKPMWENYSKKDLYYKWLKARNCLTDLRKDKNNLEAIQKT